jgi:hypothetical protein
MLVKVASIHASSIRVPYPLSYSRSVSSSAVTRDGVQDTHPTHRAITRQGGIAHTPSNHDAMPPESDQADANAMGIHDCGGSLDVAERRS